MEDGIDPMACYTMPPSGVNFGPGPPRHSTRNCFFKLLVNIPCGNPLPCNLLPLKSRSATLAKMGCEPNSAGRIPKCQDRSGVDMPEGGGGVRVFIRHCRD